MSRIEDPFAPIDLVHKQIEQDYFALQDLFGVHPTLEIPMLVMHRADKISYKEVRNSLEFFPDPPQSKHRQYIIDLAKNGCLDLQECFYDPRLHLIVIGVNARYFDPKNNSLFHEAIAHEATHSVINIDGSLHIALEEIKNFDGLQQGFDLDLVSLFNEYQKKCQREFIDLFLFLTPKLTVELNEFLPALGMTYLLGYQEFSDLKALQNAAAYLTNIDPKLSNKKNLRIFRSLVKHLPQVAGELLIRAYKGEVKALLREHPLLINANKHDLWSNYCKPLLEKGTL